MRPHVLALTAALFIPSAAFAQTAKQNFSYTAPSGMFGEGTLKWQQFRFMEEDAERTAALRSGRDPTATGSIQGSATDTVARSRPDEFARYRRQR